MCEKLGVDGYTLCGDGRSFMKSWDLNQVDLRPHSPEILSSSDAARVIALQIPAGESLQDHQVHERAWVTVIDGQVEITTAAGEQASGGPGVTVEFAPGERHAVLARTTARLLLVLAPWPGNGHPGAMSLEDKATVRQRAAEHLT
jgi:quercetin dioxygenase-like cupin family protein